MYKAFLGDEARLASLNSVSQLMSAFDTFLERSEHFKMRKVSGSVHYEWEMWDGSWKLEGETSVCSSLEKRWKKWKRKMKDAT